MLNKRTFSGCSCQKRAGSLVSATRKHRFWTVLVGQAVNEWRSCLNHRKHTGLTLCGAFGCLNIDGGTDMGRADYKTDAAPGRLFLTIMLFFRNAATTYNIRFVICHLVSASQQNICLRLDIIPHTGGYGAGMMQRRCQLSWRLCFHIFIQ